VVKLPPENKKAKLSFAHFTALTLKNNGLIQNGTVSDV
jgi:hypothetical protein